MKELFDQQSKVLAFDFMLEEYFKAGFGTLGKSDLDLLIFSTLLKYARIDDISDYALSKTLEITQTRVRNLKIKNCLKYAPLDRKSMEEVAAKMQDGRVWVSINNAEWDCENSLHRFKEFGSGNYRTYLVFTNPDQTIVGVVTSHTGKSYGESTNDVPTGVVSPMNEKMKAAFQKKGIDFSRYPNAHVYLDLCGFCGRRNSSLLLTCSPLMLLLSLALPFLVNSGSQKRKRGIIVYG
jgi:hypothetical protein